MGGMTFVPEGTFRKRATDDKPPTWWEHYYRDPELGKTVLLGKSQRMRRHLEHRFYSVYGPFQTIKGWTRGVQWLLDEHQAAKARSEVVVVAESEEVEVLGPHGLGLMDE